MEMQTLYKFHLHRNREIAHAKVLKLQKAEGRQNQTSGACPPLTLPV
jgi:hypothetical protein